ncbi:unnamed protein product [Medioppia subpectinata]|uniref:Uncharacterized protein n=1 Tax=Medioppia subpectinata TaxID=1979941 RepID=A0A7R9PT97_9ACAR|nr:unnamed protein product [Medioppia subpectinata]CAG2100273.1 unnamed protein product [Medioppia subpectinata]
MSYTITKTWNNGSIAVRDYIHEILSGVYLLSVGQPSYLVLYDYEVVEVFLLGSDDRYLELEFAPKGQYLVLQLHGSGNVTKYPLDLDSFKAKIHGDKWSGSCVVPRDYLPPDLTKFNAYGIHGTDPDRHYLALFPTPYGKYTDPNFHRLDYFQAFELK